MSIESNIAPLPEGIELFHDDWQESATLLTEGYDAKGDGVIILEGKMQHGNVINANNRVYLTEYLDPQVKLLQPKIMARALYGELDHPQTHIVSYKNVSHLVVEAGFRSGTEEVWGKYQILRDHPMGHIVKACLKEKGAIATSSRSVGPAVRGVFNNEEVNIIGKGLKVITWDLVVENSTPGCNDWRPINESVIHGLMLAHQTESKQSYSKKLVQVIDEILWGKT